MESKNLLLALTILARPTSVVQSAKEPEKVRYAPPLCTVQDPRSETPNEKHYFLWMDEPNDRESFSYMIARITQDEFHIHVWRPLERTRDSLRFISPQTVKTRLPNTGIDLECITQYVRGPRTNI